MSRCVLPSLVLLLAVSVVSACSALVRDGQYACSATGRTSDCPPDHTCREDPRSPGQLRCYASGATVGATDAGPDVVTLDASELDASALDTNPPDTRPPRDAGNDAARDMGTPDDSGFVACPPGVCSIDEQGGCDAGEACDWESRRRLGCRAAGTQSDYQSCNPGLLCEPGFTCHGDRGETRCVELCCEIGAACGSRVCVALNRATEVDVGAAGCLFPPSCDPFEPDGCGASEHCVPDRFGARCHANGLGAAGDACDTRDACGDGLTCAGEPDRCRTICRVGGEPSCPEGEHCVGLDPFSNAGGCFPDGEP